MEIKAKDMCPRCKYCLGMTSQGMYSCGKTYDDSELNIGIDVILNCANFEWKDGKVEGKASDICPDCKNGKVVVWKGISNIVCEDPYDGLIREMSREQLESKILDLFEEKNRLNGIINSLEKEKAAHMKGIERLQNQVKNLQTTNEESYKREEKLEDKVHKLERRLLKENKRFARLDSEFLIPFAHVLYPREAKICKPYSEVIEDIKRLVDKSEILEQRYDNIHYTLYKDWSDDAISCPRDIPSDVEMIEDLKKRAADSDYYKEKSELLEEKLKEANKLADSWKRDYEFVRDQLIHPIYDILYPDNPNRDINVTDLLNYVKDLKVYADENGRMYKEIQEWREKCIARDTDVDRLISLNKKLDKKISELESSRDAWSNTATARAEQVIEVTKDRDKWRKLYNSLSETCADYDKRCKEECEKKYRDEISKLQNIVTEKEVEIKGLKKDIIDLSYDRRTVESMSKKIAKLNQTVSDQEVTIKALLITIKEMCKED